MNTDPAGINERLSGTLAALLGIRIVEATPERVIAELTINDAFGRWAGRSTAAP